MNIQISLREGNRGSRGDFSWEKGIVASGKLWIAYRVSFFISAITIFFTTVLHMSTENFEYKNAMERLEAILTRIDNSEMEIDELAGSVKEATELLKKCRQILLSTEKNVQEALESLDGEANA